MLQVKFYDSVDDNLLRFSVIVAQYQGKWVFCMHKQRNTYEVPGGHRELGETAQQTACRELREETGAADFTITPVCVYSVTGKNRVNNSGEEQYGMLFVAQVSSFEPLADSEMRLVEFFDEIPQNLTYPEIQPVLIKRVEQFLLSTPK